MFAQSLEPSSDQARLSVRLRSRRRRVDSSQDDASALRCRGRKATNKRNKCDPLARLLDCLLPSEAFWHLVIRTTVSGSSTLGRSQALGCRVAWHHLREGQEGGGGRASESETRCFIELALARHFASAVDTTTRLRENCALKLKRAHSPDSLASRRTSAQLASTSTTGNCICLFPCSLSLFL